MTKISDDTLSGHIQRILRNNKRKESSWLKKTIWAYKGKIANVLQLPAKMGSCSHEYCSTLKTDHSTGFLRKYLMLEKKETQIE